jgi:hypothetical protein
LNAGTHSNYEWSTGATTSTLEVTTSGTYSVEVENAAGCTASDAITVTVESCLGVETLTQVVTVYPNPASNELQVQLATSEQVTIRVYDMQGKHVLTQTANATSTLNLESWSNGSYILEVETTQGIVRTRFVKK